MAKYQRGIYIGKFYPMHLGHVSTLLHLARMANEAFLIFHYDKRIEARLAKELGISYSIDQRVADAKAFLSDVENVTIKVLEIPDNFHYPDDLSDMKHLIETTIGGPADVQIFGNEEASTYLPYSFTHSHLLSDSYEVVNEGGELTFLRTSLIRNNYPFYKQYLPVTVQMTLDEYEVSL